ncbi:phosphatase PAP2 family protein [Nocardioides sp.]|uniref:phosphatase PAP2 family protein n=1 Tax=Nocardioides sp. TaxID=35761 RepID=UPI0031FEC522|nr:inositol phosphorylceramide synthase [Nocardioides sp.]
MTATAASGGATWIRALRELLLIVLLYLFYSGVRLLADTHVAAAVDRATSLLHLEALVGLDFEGFLNHLTAQATWLGVAMSYWYSSLHYVVTPAVLIWVFWKHRADYPRVRNALILASVIALVGYLLVPMAPPRLMADGYVDVLAQSAQYGWWSDHASAPVGLDGLTNEFAAMPSLHVGWAIWVAWAIASRTGRRGRALAIAYAVGTVIVVIGTGNHWVLDALAGALLMWFSIAVVGALNRRSSRAST